MVIPITEKEGLCIETGPSMRACISEVSWDVWKLSNLLQHCNDVIMGAMASQITSLSNVYSTVYSGAAQRKQSKLRIRGLCAGNSPVTAQVASNAENISIWWRHHESIVHRFEYLSCHLIYISIYSLRFNVMTKEHFIWQTKSSF